MKRIIVDTNALNNNYSVIKKKTGENIAVYFVVKGNAYGLDTALYVEHMVKLGARRFATADIEDAAYIKKFCQEAEVLLMTPVNTEESAKAVVENGIVATVENASGAALIAKYASSLYPVHIKIDMGLGRYGVKHDDFKELENICKTKGISVDGVFTHLPKTADKHVKETNIMIMDFFACVYLIKAFGASPKMIHALGSVGVFRYLNQSFGGESFTAVRVGSAMVGRLPAIVGKTGLKEVATLEADVSSIKLIRKGECVGYSGIYKAKRDIMTAVLSVGYADGFSVAKSAGYCRRIDICRCVKHDIEHLVKKPCVTVNIKGSKVCAVGTIGMSASSFDVTGMNVSVGDVATVSINPIYADSKLQRIYKAID